MEFKESLKNARLKVKLSQLQVSLKTDITRDSLRSWEGGISIPNVKKLTILCRLYKTTPNDLLGFN